jgi:hypothetical protein
VLSSAYVLAMPKQKKEISFPIIVSFNLFFKREIFGKFYTIFLDFTSMDLYSISKG